MVVQQSKETEKYGWEEGLEPTMDYGEEDIPYVWRSRLQDIYY